MSKESEIKRLEAYVERLLDGYTGLKEQNRKLEYLVAQEQERSNRLQDRLDSMEADRGDISSRVGALIDRIERWEQELEIEQPEVDSAEMAVNESGAEAVVVDEPTQGSDEERGGGVQGSLFTTGSRTG